MSSASSIARRLKGRMQAVGKTPVMVAGPFRSGTNLMKYYLDDHYAAEVVFSKWFWKHGVPPTCDPVAVPEGVPICILARDPAELAISLYKFWQKRRPELDVGDSISDFIRMPLIVYDNTGGNVRPKYLFPSPTDYWNQYYYSWIHWPQVEARRRFIRIEDLHDDPVRVVSDFARFAGLKQTKDTITPPERYLSASPDGKSAGAAQPEFEKGAKDRTLLSDEDRAEIARRVNPEVAARLGYDDYVEGA